MLILTVKFFLTDLCVNENFKYTPFYFQCNQNNFFYYNNLNWFTLKISIERKIAAKSFLYNNHLLIRIVISYLVSLYSSLNGFKPAWINKTSHKAIKRTIIIEL